jgi:hypothetical protein
VDKEQHQLVGSMVVQTEVLKTPVVAVELLMFELMVQLSRIA